MKRFIGLLLVVFLSFSCSDQPFVVGVDSPLRVVYISPTDSATNVSRDVVVKIVFSEPVVESTLTDNIALYDYSKKDESLKVETELAYSKDTNTVTLKPKKALNYATQYLIRVKSDVTKVDTKDSKGGKLAREISTLFTTEYLSDLRVLSVYPANGATEVAPDSNIVVQFSEPVDNTPPSFDGSSSFVVCDMGSTDSYKDGKCNDPIAGNWTFDEKKTTATFKPEKAFGYTRSVRLILSKAIRSERAKQFGDKVGNNYYGHLIADYIVDFKTKLLDRFDVVSISPANGATGVSLDSKIVIRFSEPVNTESVVFFNKEGDEESLKESATILVENITDKNNIAPFYMKGEWDSENKALTLTSVDSKDGETVIPFPYSADIRITLKHTIQSERGKGLVNPEEIYKKSQGYLNNGEADIISGFSTIDPPDLLIVNIRPEADSKDISIRSQIRIKFSEPVDLATITYPSDINSENYRLRIVDITDENNRLLVEPLDTANPVLNDKDEPSTVVFKPKYPLDYLHTYELEIREGISSLRATQRGGFLRLPQIQRFTTEGTGEFYVSGTYPADGSQNNGIDTKVRVRFNRGINTDSLLEEFSKGSVSSITNKTITDENATFVPDTLKGYYVRFTKNDTECSGFIISNQNKSFEVEKTPDCAVDNTYSYVVYKPALVLSNQSEYISPVDSKKPFFFYNNFITSGVVTSATSDSITDSTKNFAVDELKGKLLRILRGKSAGETYEIKSNTSNTISITAQFTETPDSTSEYAIVTPAEVLKSSVSSADRRSIKIDGANFDVDEFKGFEVEIISSSGEAFRKGIIANDPDTLYVDSDLESIPDNTGQVVIRDAREFIYTPGDIIPYGSLVRGVIPSSTVLASIRDISNGSIEDDFNFSFKISESPILSIKSVSPSDKADNIDTETTITIYFSEAIDPKSVEKASGNIVFLDDNNNPVDFTISPVGVETDNIEIIPVKTALNQPRLKYSTSYTITLKADIASLRGGRLAKDYSFKFKTLDPVPLSLLYSQPSSVSGIVATGIKRETSRNSGVPTSFVFAFSEGLKQANIDTTTLKVEDVTSLQDPFDLTKTGVSVLYTTGFNAADDPPDGSLGIGLDNTLTITPTDLLNYSQVIRIVIRGQDDAQGVDCSKTSSCKTLGIFTSDRATVEGGQLRNTYVVVFRVEDPEPLRIVNVSSERGDATLKRDISGSSESLLVKFSEGVKQSSFVLGSTVMLEDVTGVADPVNGNAISSIPATVSFLNNQGTPAQDSPTTTDLIGTDTIAKIKPAALLPYGTVLRLRLKGENPPSLSGIQSDRATNIDGQLHKCTPDSGYDCNGSGEYVYIFRVEGISDLYVKSFNPGDGSTGIPQNARDVVIVFSEPVDCSTVNSNNIKVERIYPSLSTLSGNFNCINDVVTFTADEDFGYSRDIRVTVGTGVRSLNAQYVNPNADPLMGHIRRSVSATFSTEDPPAPYIVSMNPGPISTGVKRDSEITVSFNQALDPASVNSTNFTVTDTSSMNIINCATLTLINSNTTIRCVPQSLFGYSHTISVSIRGGTNGIRSAIATDRGGWFNPVPDPYSYTFKIVDIPELLVLATNFSGSESFAPNANLQIIFNSYVNFNDIVGNPADISDDKIFLVKQADINTRIPITISNPIAGGESSPSTIRITPSSPLDYSTGYSVFVLGDYPSGVCRPERNSTNLGGCITNANIENTPYKGLRFDFAVSSAPGLAVESVIPPDKSTGIDRKPEIRISFNNEIVFGSVAGNICLTKGDNLSTDCSGPLAVQLQAFTQVDSRTVSTYPVNDLDFDTTYTIVVTKGVVDIYGDTLDSYYTSTFTTITSTLVQDITVWDGTQYSNYLFSAINDMHIRVRFTEDMDTSTVDSNKVYLTYKDEFGQIIPLRGTIDWEAAPLNKKVMYFTPMLGNIFACDGKAIYAWGNDGSTKIAPDNEFYSPSYTFTTDDIGKILYISGSSNGYNGYYTISGVDAGSAVLSGAKFSSIESPLSFKILNEVPSLPYNTVFTFHITTNIYNAAHTKNIAPTSGNYELVKDFKSAGSPQIEKITYSNSVIRNGSEYFYVYDTNLYDATDVPIVSKFKITFTEPLNVSSVEYRSVMVSELWGQDGKITAGSNVFEITTSSFSSNDVGKYIIFYDYGYIGGPYRIVAYNNPNSVTLSEGFLESRSNLKYDMVLDGSTPGIIYTENGNRTIVYDASKLPGYLKYNHEYKLMLMGRPEMGYPYTIELENGNFLKGITIARFTTSAETTVKFNPVDWSTTNNEINDPMLFVAIFSRSIDIGSVDESSFYVIQQGEKLPVLYAYYADFPNIVTMIPIPAFKTGSNANFTVSRGVRDYRGNPLSKDWNSSLMVSSAPGGAALTLENPSSVTPSSGSTIKANQEFTLKWLSAGGNFRDLLLPTSFNNYSIKLKNNADNSYVDVTTELVPGGNNGDSIIIKPKSNLKGGVSYTLTVDLTRCANLYRLPGGSTLTYNYTVENTPPQILAAGPTGSSNLALSRVWIAFNEDIDINTINQNTIILQDLSSGNQIYGVYSKDYDSLNNRWFVYLTPSTPLHSNLGGYRVTVKSGAAGVKDLGGIPLASDYTYTFSVDNIAPQVLSVSPSNGTINVPVDSNIIITFNEPISPSTIFGATESEDGSVNIEYTSACGTIKKSFGCIRLSDDFTKVVFLSARPYYLIGDRLYRVDLNETIVSDLAGNVMNFADLPAVSSFTTVSSYPILDCEALPSASNQPIEFYFNENVDYSTPGSIVVFNVLDGNPVSVNIAGTNEPNGYKLTITPQAGSWASGDYGYIISKSLKDGSGNSVIREYNGYFTIP